MRSLDPVHTLPTHDAIEHRADSLSCPCGPEVRLYCRWCEGQGEDCFWCAGLGYRLATTIADPAALQADADRMGQRLHVIHRLVDPSARGGSDA